MEEICRKLEWLEHEVPGAIESAPAAFAELETMEKAKCTSQCAKVGKDLKKLCAQLTESSNKLKKDCTDMAECLKTCSKDLDDGKFIEHGTVCRDAKLCEIKECYEKCYGPIPAAAKMGKDGGDGCCTIF